MVQNYEDKPLVSVIIPTYHMWGKDLLKRALDSVRNQTYQNIETIIVAGDTIQESTDAYINGWASRDALLKPTDIINEYGLPTEWKSDDKGFILKYASQIGKGRVSALNQGLSMANGNYVAFLDADDTLAEQSIEKRVLYLISNPEKDAVFGNAKYHIHDSKGDLKEDRLKTPPGKIDSQEDFLREFFYGESVPFHTMTGMYKREIITALRGFDARFKKAENYDFVLKVLSKYNVGFIDEVVYNYTLDTHKWHERVKFRLTMMDEWKKIIAHHIKNKEERNKLIRKKIYNQSKQLVKEIFTAKK